MIVLKQSGDFKYTEGLLKRINKNDMRRQLEKFGKLGVDALRDATPKDTGKTSESWQYEIKMDKTGVSITWKNTNVVDGVPIAIIIQYGHATKNGGYVKGIDYVNPAVKPIFEDLANEVWKGVTG